MEVGNAFSHRNQKLRTTWVGFPVILPSCKWQVASGKCAVRVSAPPQELVEEKHGQRERWPYSLGSHLAKSSSMSAQLARSCACSIQEPAP